MAKAYDQEALSTFQDAVLALLLWHYRLRPRSLAAGEGGTLRVYATPAMVMFIEEVCRTMVEPYLAPGESTVGVSLKIRHLAPTPVGLEVRCRAEVVKVEDGVITFQAEVWDPAEKIGEGEHKRALIGIERFLKRVQAKMPA